MSAFKDSMNRADLNTVADQLRTVKLGKLLRGQLPQVIRKSVPVLDGAQLATLTSNVLPNDAKACTVIRANGRSIGGGGSGTIGADLAIQAYGATPGANQIAVAPNGDIVTLAADKWTDLDITYLPERGDVVVLPELPVAVGLLTLPSMVLDAAGTSRAIYLINAVVTAGTVTGRKIILVPAAGLPATTKAQIHTNKLQVQFNNATDAPTKAVVTLLITAADDLGAILEGADSEL
jgi:hypothetical protein